MVVNFGCVSSLALERSIFRFTHTPLATTDLFLKLLVITILLKTLTQSVMIFLYHKKEIRKNIIIQVINVNIS